jgi:hypothetical protein
MKARKEENIYDSIIKRLKHCKGLEEVLVLEEDDW